MPVSTTLRVRADGPRIVTDSATSGVLILRAGRVVGRSYGPRSGAAVPLRLQTGRDRLLQAVPRSLVLAGCASTASGSGKDPAALAPGPYSLIAVLGYRSDSLNAAADLPAPHRAATFCLVSEPVPITLS